MPSACYHQAGDADHNPGVIEDSGCEVSSRCVYCPLSRCKFDDMHWYRNGIRRGADLLAANDIEREGLTLAQAAVRFRTSERTIARIRERCQRVANGWPTSSPTRTSQCSLGWPPWAVTPTPDWAGGRHEAERRTGHGTTKGRWLHRSRESRPVGRLQPAAVDWPYTCIRWPTNPLGRPYIAERPWPARFAGFGRTSPFRAESPPRSGRTSLTPALTTQQECVPDENERTS